MSGLELKINGAVAELELNNPSKLNALTREMLKALQTHLDRLERDPDIRVVLVTAAAEVRPVDA